MEGNNRIRVTYDPYRKLIKCEYQREGGNTWELPSAGGKLAAVFQQGTLKGSLQNHAHSILQGITDDYCMHGQGVDLLFRGTEEDWEYLQMVVKGTDGTKIVCQGKAGQLSSAGEILPKIENIFQKLAEDVDDLTEREVKKPIRQYLETVRPDVVLYVTGTYSAGKSTFINALIGEELLPSAIDPTTAHIFKIVVKGKGDWVDTEVRFQYLGKEVALKFRSDGYVLEDLNQWPDLELKHCLDQELRDTTPGPAYICKALSVLNNFNKLKNPNPENGQQAPHTAYISTQIEVQTPFYRSSLPLEKFHFLIFDTPGTNAKNHKDHLAAMREALTEQTNGLPILLVPPTQMDSNDVETLRNDIHEIGGAMDESNILIVVTQADGQPFSSLKKQAQGKEQLAARQGVENRICYTSAVLGFYAKKGSYPMMGCQSAEDLEDSKERFDANGGPYRSGRARLYQIDSLPQDQLEKVQRDGDQANETGTEQEKLFHNSGLWAVEREIERFAKRFASYNKCWQAKSYLSQAIDAAQVVKGNQCQELDALKKSRETEFDQQKKALLDQLSAEKECWWGISWQAYQKGQMETQRKYIPDTNNLSAEAAKQWRKNKAAKPGQGGQAALELFRDWATSVVNDRTHKEEEALASFAVNFWTREIDKLKASCIQIVKGSAALTEDEKSFMENYILKTQPPAFKEISFTLPKAAAREKSFLFFKWTEVNPKSCAHEMISAIQDAINTFSEHYLTDLYGRVKNWTNDFIEGLKRELPSLNPNLAEINKKIEAYMEQIKKLERTHKRLGEAQKELNSYFTLKEDGGTK